MCLCFCHSHTYTEFTALYPLYQMGLLYIFLIHFHPFIVNLMLPNISFLSLKDTISQFIFDLGKNRVSGLHSIFPLLHYRLKTKKQNIITQKRYLNFALCWQCSGLLLKCPMSAFKKILTLILAPTLEFLISCTSIACYFYIFMIFLQCDI